MRGSGTLNIARMSHIRDTSAHIGAYGRMRSRTRPHISPVMRASAEVGTPKVMADRAHSLLKW
jgi:hypothetical protein